MSVERFGRFLVASIPSGLVATLISLPFSPSIYALMWFGHRCFGPTPPGSTESPTACLTSFAIGAPFVALMGPLTHDDQPPDNVWPGILLTSVIIGIAFTMYRAYRATSKSARETDQP